MIHQVVDHDTSRCDGSLEMFNYSMQQNKASLVGLHSVGLLDMGLVGRISRAMEKAIADHESPQALESLNYLNFEPLMTAIMGSPEASLLHLGRSRQDMISTLNRQLLRTRMLTTMGKLASAREALFTLAKRHVETISPTYTHGVPAQPTTFGHYLLAFAEAFERVHERLFQSYRRINRSPYGVAVSTTSRFGLDRDRLAKLLGFDAVEENSYGANHVLALDAVQDAVGPLVCLSLHVGALVQDLTQIHATARPWLTIAASPLTGVSSIMPQKRNPRVFEHLREMASEVLGGTHTAAIMAHNCTTGLTDIRETLHKLPLDVAASMLDLLASMFGSVVIDAQLALDETSRDYSTSTEIADALYEKFKVPFRTSHHFASQLAEYGRTKGVVSEPPLETNR